MLNRVDEKGKVFTQRVRKVSVEVEIVTIQGHVKGHLHVSPEQRVKDLLNSSDEQFLAVTGVTIRSSEGWDTREVGFIAINKQHIVSVIPINEGKQTYQEEDYYPS